MIEAGQPAPSFSAQADDGRLVTLESLRGRSVVLYFYPKDDTPGCTTEACELRDAFPRFSSADATIIGVSPDSVASHVKFKTKFSLPFMLLADTNHAMAEAYGVWKEKSMYGRTYWGVERTTFLIDPSGVVQHVWHKVKAEGHAAAVAAALTGANSPAAAAPAAPTGAKSPAAAPADAPKASAGAKSPAVAPADAPKASAGAKSSAAAPADAPKASAGAKSPAVAPADAPKASAKKRVAKRGT